MSHEPLISRVLRLVRGNRRLLMGLAGVGFFKIVATLASVGITVILARLLGPVQFGAYSFAFSLAAMLTFPVLQGLPVLVLREVSGSPAAERTVVASAMINYSDRLCLGFLVPAACLIMLCIWLGYPEKLVHEPWLAVAAIALPVAMVAVLVRGSVLRAYGRAVLGQVPDLLLRPIVFLCLLGVLWVLPARTAALAMALHLLGAVVSLFAVVLMLRGLLSERASAVPVSPKAEWFRALLPLSIVAGVQLVNSQFDLVALGWLASSTEVGIYKIASTLAVQVSFVLTVVNAVIAPRFAALFGEGLIGELRRINRLGAAVSFMLGLLVVVLYVAFGRQLISLTVGKSYLAAFEPLLVLSIAHLATLWAGATNVLLNMIGRERDVLASALVSAIVDVVLNMLLIPLFGMLGAAWATATSLVVWRVMLSRFVRARLDGEALH